MKGIDAGTWERLTVAQGDRLVARLAMPELTDRVFCGLDSAARRHLLIPLRPGEKSFVDRQSHGILVATTEMAIGGKSAAPCIDLTCLETSGHPVLDIVGADIAQALARNGDNPGEIVKQVLKKWRYFWAKAGLPLSREQQLGLFAELLFLKDWLLPAVGSTAAESWRGPLGSRHDFEMQGASVEVKATTSQRGRLHHIASLTQLEPPEHGQLFLFSTVVREEGGASLDLPTMVSLCRAALQPFPDAEAHLDDALARLGYIALHEQEYAEHKYRIVEAALFEVARDFPKLTQENAPAATVPGIEKVTYEINLNTFDHLIVANSPAGVPFKAA